MSADRYQWALTQAAHIEQHSPALPATIDALGVAKSLRESAAALEERAITAIFNIFTCLERADPSAAVELAAHRLTLAPLLSPSLRTAIEPRLTSIRDRASPVNHQSTPLAATWEIVLGVANA